MVWLFRAYGSDARGHALSHNLHFTEYHRVVYLIQ
jgi:hypothetical protein